ncbi:MAG: helix-turn-helix domain-containing protein [Bacteroides sp.]|nr:helix-turn-helix domain-containing protein [Bacteroides sp.]
MAFGDKLYELLEDRDISQKEFAKTLNIAPTTLNGYIKNKRQPDFELVKRISAALNVSADFLLDNGENAFNITAKELSMLRRLRLLSKEQQQIIYDLVSISAKCSKNDPQ